MGWLRVPKKIYFKPGSYAVALRELTEVYGLERAFIVSDSNLYRLGVVTPVDRYLAGLGMRTAEYFYDGGTPTFDTVRAGMQKMNEFAPDAIIGIGGGSAMNLAKAMWLQYENPDLDIETAAKEYNRINSGHDEFPPTGNKARLVLVATTAGTGSECSPFSVLENDKGKRTVIAGFGLLPEIAIIDPDFSKDLSTELTKEGGLRILTQAVRAYTAKGADDYSNGFAIEAVKAVLEELPTAVTKGADAPVSREKLANAAANAGIAYGNSVGKFALTDDVYPADGDTPFTKLNEKTRDAIIKLANAVGFSGSDKKVYDDWIKACKALAKL